MGERAPSTEPSRRPFGHHGLLSGGGAVMHPQFQYRVRNLRTIFGLPAGPACSAQVSTHGSVRESLLSESELSKSDRISADPERTTSASGDAHSERAKKPSMTLVVPARNEARNLAEVLPELPDDCEMVLVDAHSVDDTVAVAQQFRHDVRVVRQNRIGKGNALAWGFYAASGVLS